MGPHFPDNWLNIDLPGPAELATHPTISKNLLPRCTRGRYAYSETWANCFLRIFSCWKYLGSGATPHGHDATGYGPPNIYSSLITNMVETFYIMSNFHTGIEAPTLWGPTAREAQALIPNILALGWSSHRVSNRPNSHFYVLECVSLCQKKTKNR